MEGFEFFTDKAHSAIMVFPNGYNRLTQIITSKLNHSIEATLKVKTVTPLRASDYAYIQNVRKNWTKITAEHYARITSAVTLPNFKGNSFDNRVSNLKPVQDERN